MHLSLGDGVGVGSDVVGSDVVGSAVGVDAAVDAGARGGVFVTVPAPLVADCSEVSFGDADGESDALSFEAEGDGEAEGSAEAEPAVPDVSSRGWAVVPGDDVDAPPSVVSPPAEAAPGLVNGMASVPSSARLRPPAASTQAALTSRILRRRRRWAAALRSRRLPSAPEGSSTSS